MVTAGLPARQSTAIKEAKEMENMKSARYRLKMNGVQMESGMSEWFSRKEVNAHCTVHCLDNRKIQRISTIRTGQRTLMCHLFRMYFFLVLGPRFYPPTYPFCVDC